MYPRLAGQYKNYLIHALNSYKSGERKNAIMSGFAAGLSSQDIVDLSTYTPPINLEITSPARAA